MKLKHSNKKVNLTYIYIVDLVKEKVKARIGRKKHDKIIQLHKRESKS